MLDVPGQPSATRAIDLPHPERTLPGGMLDARWSDDGSRILVARVVDPRPWPLLDAARPDLGALLAIGGLVLLVSGTTRVVCRPRVPGRSYCRRCNHDLNADPGARPKSGRCPECGLDLGTRAIVHGATRGRRLARVLVPSLAALGLGVSLFASSVASPRAPSAGVTWPVAAASEIPGWPWMRTATVDTTTNPAGRIDIIRVEPGELVLESQVTIDVAWQPALARPDGTVIAWMAHSPDTAWVPTVRWFDSTTGRGGSVGIATAHAGFPTLCGWTADGREIVALVQRTGFDYDRRDDGTAIIDVDVVAVDPRTGTVRPAGRGRGHATGGGGPSKGWAVGPAIAAIGAGPSPRTVTVTAQQAGASQGATIGELVLRELTVSDGSDTRIVPLRGGTGVAGASGFRRAWLREDGRLAVEFASYGWSGNPGLARTIVRIIDPVTGAIEEPPPTGQPPVADASPVPGTPSPDGTRRLRVELERTSPSCLDRIRILVDDVRPPVSSAPAQARPR